MDAVPDHESLAEYRAARDAVGVVDRSDLGVVEVTGRDRAKFLHALLSNDIAALAPGQGCAATLLDIHGKVQVTLIVWVFDDRVRLLTPPGMGESTVAALDHYLFAEKVTLEDVTGQRALLMLVGPAAEARPLGAAALESLRMEAGTPRFGVDVDATVLLPEIPSAHLISHPKGCYPGQEVVVRIRDRGHVNRHLRGLLLEGEVVPPRGAEVVADGAVVGQVTSATLSLGLRRPIALAFIKRQQEPGARVRVSAGADTLPATVSDLPFAR